jgi:hypothetical protein|tara:strand:- start:440 stop:844 length:405 start_codon:yes stop_codon:yes gene_type:complete
VLLETKLDARPSKKAALRRGTGRISTIRTIIPGTTRRRILEVSPGSLTGQMGARGGIGLGRVVAAGGVSNGKRSTTSERAHAGVTREQVIADPLAARRKFNDIEDLFDKKLNCLWQEVKWVNPSKTGSVEAYAS